MKDPVGFPNLLEMFFTKRLIGQRRASPHTIASYRDTFRLLLQFAEKRLAKPPSSLTIEDLNAPFLGSFLDDLESTRTNGARSRNLRLTAIRSFFRYAALEIPEHAGLIQRVLVIPNKRQPRPLVGFLTRAEIDALLAAPDRDTWLGRRDHALLLTAIQTGLRLAEITSIRQQDVSLATGAHVRCEGKGRKERCTPLTKSTITVLKAWIKEQGEDRTQILFPSLQGNRLSSDAVQHLVSKYAAGAQHTCPSLADKRVSPHVLRHYLPFRIMSCRRSVAFIFGRFTRSSGDIEIGFSAPCGGQEADFELYHRQRNSSLATRPKAHVRRSGNLNVTGRADHYEPPGRPSLLSEQPATGTRLCRVNCRGLRMIGPKIIDPKCRPVPLPDIVRKGS